MLTTSLFRRRKPCASWSPFKRPRSLDCIIADSKQLTAPIRATAYDWITAHCHWGVGVVPAAFIEEEGILAATERAMLLALEHLARSVTPTYLLVDGRDHFFFPYPHSPIIRGDSLEPCIAAASIIAKVTRDRIMIDEEKHHPTFRFAQHKGYGTREHIASIREHGPCPLHRPYFLQKILSGSADPDLTLLLEESFAEVS